MKKNKQDKNNSVKFVMAIRVIKKKCGSYSFEKKVIKNNEIENFFSSNK